MNAVRILVVDDDEGLLPLIGEMLAEGGFEATGVATGEEALQNLARDRFDLVLADIHLPGIGGHDLLRKAQEIAPGIPVVLMTGYGEIQGAIQAIREGAADYIAKPFSGEILREMVGKVLRRRRLPEEAGPFVTQSSQMKAVLKKIEKAASTQAPVLITGETGVGKELAARYLHAASDRRKEKFIAINCAAIPRDLLESELFGHEKGAFTGASDRKIGKFEAAGSGTLFLDEVGEMAIELQAKLLRVLQEKEFFRVGGNVPVKVSTRVVAATNRDLKEMVRQGRFREDLYFRLNVLPIRIPPLRERREDIPLLISLFLKGYEEEHRLKRLGIEEGAVEKLKRYRWPGNARELENLLLRAAITAKDGVIRETDIILELEEEPRLEFLETAGEVVPMADLEKRAILTALRVCQGNRTHAAKALGISLSTLKNKIRQYGSDLANRN